MKKIIFLIAITAMLSLSSFAQLSMNSSGQIGIGTSASSYYKLKVNGYTYSKDFHLDGPLVWDYSPGGRINTYYYGLSIQGCYSTSVGIGCNYSSGTTLKLSYQYSQPTYTLDVNGNARISGDIYASNYLPISSDDKIKKNIKQLDGTDAVVKLFKINSISYEYKSKEELTELHNNNILHFGYDTLTFYDDSEKTYREEVRLSIPDYSKGNNFGFVAQDVEKVFPELVREDSLTNIKSICYTEFIPLLLEALKEQNETIEGLKTEINDMKSEMLLENKKSTFNNVDNSVLESNLLFQNNPNPFKESTQIKYYLDENVKYASIRIYNMNGTQLKSFQLNQYGNSSVTIDGGELHAGMFIYALIVEGLVVDTKQMILTD
ncbi:MAG: tail fiber domain-containing protein [Bacteroidales bacterium]|nr:tail fiber domain-containing protein [Saprospiraceae bacterium]MCF8380858.1 tail fiber domain-containing protein [Bacteroidales bacterium]